MNDHMCIFTIEQLGLNRTALIKLLGPIYEQLPWDWYDVRRHQTKLLLQAASFPTVALKHLCHDYYQGNVTISALAPYLNQLSPKQRHCFEQVQPFRKRAIASFLLTQAAPWQVSLEPHPTFVMNTTDHRQHARLFTPIATEIVTADIITHLLTAVARMVQSQQPQITQIRLVMHLMRTVVRPGGNSTNAPEGIHQDGSDYIISALVIARQNITGGTSRIYGPDKKTCLLNHTLQPGEGIFQSDHGSSLWHDVTPIHTTHQVGYRDIVGLDIHLIDSQKAS